MPVSPNAIISGTEDAVQSDQNVTPQPAVQPAASASNPAVDSALTSYAGKYPAAVLEAAKNIFASKPDQAQAFLKDYNGDLDNWLNAFQGWWSDNGSQVASKLGEFGPEMGLLDALGFKVNPAAVPSDVTLPDGTTGTAAPTGPGVAQPAEQVLGNYALDQATQLIQGDAQRKADAQTIVDSYQPVLNGARDTIASLFPTTPGGTSAALQGQLDASNAAATAQTTALNTQLDSLKSNLTGELATRAANIQTQVNALTSGLTTYSAAERAALAAQVQSQMDALNTEVASRKQALEQQLSTMGTAVTAHDQQMRAALETELNQLNAAQKPLNDARISSAQSLAAAANLGAQSQMDAVRAKAADAGYIGSSTGDNMAIARAAIEGRQNAANALGGARVANAVDNRDIAKYGANTQFGIASDTANANRDLSFYGANENRGLSDYASAGKRTISDFGSTGERSIADNSAAGNLGISQFAAGENRSLGDYGATQTRTLGDFGANENRNIADSTAQRNLGYFSDDLSRRLASLNLPAAAIGTEFQIRNLADQYGQSGFNQAMTDLGFFRTNGGTAPGAVTFTGNQPIDNGYENLGAGLVTAAGNIAQANNYWSKPTTTVATTPIAPATGAAPTFNFTMPKTDTSLTAGMGG